jgi:predicted NBD/HSP70 family sugar kinase
MPAVAGFNQSVIIDHIRRSSDGMSRVELVGATGLSAQTISNVTRRLLAQGLVRETERRITGPGKPRTMLRLEPTGRYAVGVHMDPALLTSVLLDLEGNPVVRSRTRSPVSGGAHDTVETIAAEVDALIERAEIPRSRVVGLGIAAPGPLDAAEGVIMRPPLMPSWSDFPVRDELAAATGLPALMAKDATAAVVAERWKNPAGSTSDFAFVYYGTGVGLGFVLADEIFLGASSNAGDVGHVLVAPDGPLCTCGRRGCFGEAVRPLRLVEQGIQRGLLSSPSEHLDFETVDDLLTELVTAGVKGDPVALDVIGASIQASAVFLVNLGNLLDIDRIVFGGPYWPRVQRFYEEQLADRMRSLHMDNLPHPVALGSSVIGEDVAAVGAACLVLDSTFSPRSSQLFIAAEAPVA